MAHNVDSTSLTQLIEAFRVLQTKDSITPETLGALLSRISELLASAGTAVSVDTLMQWYETDAPKIERLRRQISDIGHIRPSEIFPKAQIACVVDGGKLYIHGAKKLIDAGYVPYVFRNIRKRSRLNDCDRTFTRTHGLTRKGWTVFGSHFAYRMKGGILEFSTNGPSRFHSRDCASGEFTTAPSALVTVATDSDGVEKVAWGRDCIPVHTVGEPTYRQLRLKFGVGFAKPVSPCRRRVTLADLASSFATFTVVLCTDGRWTFGRP